MEASCSSSTMENGNGTHLRSEPSWMNLKYFMVKLARITGTEITGNDIFSHSVGDKILKALGQRQSELIRFEGFMKSLCDITNISIEGEDICSQSFVNSVLEHVKQDLVLVEGIRTNLAERRPSQSGTKRVVENCDSQPTLATCHSNSQSVPSKLAEKASNENKEVPQMNSVPDDVPVFPVASQIIAIGLPSVPIPPRPFPEVISISDEQQETPASPTLCVNIATDNHDNMQSPSILSPNLPEEGNRSGAPAGGDFSQLQITNENQFGTGSGVMVDNMLNEFIQTSPIPSTSRQAARNQKESAHLQVTSNIPGTSANGTKQVKRLSERFLRKKIHASSGFRGGRYCCTCLSKFKTENILKNHIKRFNSVWKFKCDKCQKKCYDLTKLRCHLKKEHGIDKPLKDFVIGCTLCGTMFKNRMEFNVHKRTQHNIHNMHGSRRPCKTPRLSELPPINPMESSPPVVKIEVVDIEDDENAQKVPRQNEVIDLVSEDEGDNVDEDVYFPPILQGNPPPPPPPTAPTV